MKINKLTVEAIDSGVNLHVDGAPEGIHIEWEILPQVLNTLTELNEAQN